MFCAFTFNFDWNLFQLIALLKPDLLIVSIVLYYLFDKATTGTQGFVSVVASSVAPVAEEITQKMRLILQLINGISRIL